MSILELPPELFHEILVQMCISRGITRAMRLRLVCKTFAAAVIPALHESRLLDHFNPFSITIQWYAGDPNNASTRLWHSYLVHRVQRETGPVTNQYSEIRMTAERVCRESKSIDLLEVIDALCWLVLEKSLYTKKNYKDGNGADTGHGQTPYVGLLAAAARFNLLSLARELLEEGHDPITGDNGIFTCAFEVAAWWGSQQMLELFQQHVPKFGDDTTDADRRLWCGRAMAMAVRGAVIRGDLHRVRLALSHEAYKLLDGDNAVGRPFSIEKSLDTSIRSALTICRSPEIYAYLKSVVPEQGVDDIVSLKTHALHGNIEMVRYLIDYDMNIRETPIVSSVIQILLYNACRKFQEAAVDPLLELSANHNHEIFFQAELNMALEEATQVGSLSIVRKLLDFGADPSPPTSQVPPVEGAVNVEHTAMVELLLARGATLDGKLGTRVLKSALKSGLESMVDLLVEHGARLE
ncbi:ankyrin repeat-containing domain protein [Biscogniauxia sp. FL1348]|nr:ankyrin repeat-containing domain protein [Biscogniauxia sp. FL1348]